MNKELVKHSLVQQSKDYSGPFSALMLNYQMRQSHCASQFVERREYIIPEYQMVMSIQWLTHDVHGFPDYQVMFREAKDLPDDFNAGSCHVLPPTWSSGLIFKENIIFDQSRIIFSVDCMEVVNSPEYVLSYRTYEKKYAELVFDVKMMKFIGDCQAFINVLFQLRSVKNQHYIDYRTTEAAIDGLDMALFHGGASIAIQESLEYVFSKVENDETFQTSSMVKVLTALAEYLNQR